MDADFEPVFDEEELANKSDMRGKKRSARVDEIIEEYEKALRQGAIGIKVRMADDKERGHWHTFRYRLTAAADALGIEVKVSIRKDEELALVTFRRDAE
ncbi:hypothetical protein [Gordonibacter urolithinfaciens]|uniref:hypothetical protein n=1 Tax=Gordonibacter urolithinfaciens TaxID=1335613 RepID=UPI003AAC6BA9